MPRGKKKETKVTARETVSSGNSAKSKASAKSRNVEDDSEGLTTKTARSRSRRATANKPKGRESLMPNSRERSLVSKSVPQTPVSVKTVQKQTAMDKDKFTTETNIRSRSSTRTKVLKPGLDPPPPKDLMAESRTSGSKEDNDVGQRVSKRTRSQKNNVPLDDNIDNNEKASSKSVKSMSVKDGLKKTRKGKTVPQRTLKGKVNDMSAGKSEETAGIDEEDDALISSEGPSDPIEDSVKLVKTSKGRRGLLKNGTQEESLTKVSEVKSSKSKQTPLVEGAILNDTTTGKWKSFNNQSLSLKNKRLSSEKESLAAVNNSKKRKSSLTTDELNPTPTKKPTVKGTDRKVGFQSIAESYAKNGKIVQKNAPRKTLCNMDILGLLDDDIEEEEEVPKPHVEENVYNEINDRVHQETETSNKSTNSFSQVKDRVPVWKQVNTSSSNIKLGVTTKSSDDVFNPENYGEEEFGPEDLNPKKKRVRKKKKDTKAILVFGGKAKSGKNAKSVVNEVKKAVKESHNLNTPEIERKKTKKAVVKGNKKLIQPIPNIFDNPPSSSLSHQPKAPIIKVTNYSTDISHGAQNYFDSEIHQYEPCDDNDDFYECPDTGGEVNRSGVFGATLPVPSSKNYKTPAIPKKISRLQSDNSSTPNQKDVSKPFPVTIKEQIKCAFGFDDSEDDEVVSENESISISPVRKVSNPALDMLDNESVLSSISTTSGASATNRLSSIQGSIMGVNLSRGPQIPIIRKPAESKRNGPFRLNLPPPSTLSVERHLLAQVKALKEKDVKKKQMTGKKPSRFSPRKPIHSSTINGDPIHSSTLLDFDRDVPKPKNAYEMMKEASQNPKEKAKKLVKKVTKNPPTLEQSSLYEDPPAEPCNLAKLSDRKSDNQKHSDKENSDNNSPLKPKKPVVSRVYKRKSMNASVASKPSISFDQSIPKKTPKKETKQEKAIKQWTQLQTSHFSEVDDFDLSFS